MKNLKSKKKIITFSLIGFMAVGTSALAATPLLANITAFLAGETNKQVNIINVDTTASDIQSELETTLTNTKNQIAQEISNHGADEKQRVSDEIIAHKNEIEAEANKILTEDLPAMKQQLTDTADQKIAEGELALDQIATQIFPSINE